ncbi:hypothetical protein FXB39_09310 [Nocardioides sp. BGMRC 2183]|nr:hypothetical protein FXB39_09310 [Nocardioides sp. BGMRC 2183]
MKHRVPVRLCTVLIALVVATLVAGGRAQAAPEGGSQGAAEGTSTARPSLPSTCFWFGPYVKSNPGFNVSYLDTGATYWTANISIPEGAEVVLRGKYAHARYQSFSTYRSDGSGDELDGRNDTQIVPDRGSRNPFLTGARRSGNNDRSFTLAMLDEPKPADAERRTNTVYAGSPDDRQILIMRLYVPDKGRGLLGGVGFPKPELHLADGSVLTGEAMCRALDVTEKMVPMPTVDPDEYAKLRDRAGAPPGFPAQSTPEFRAYYNKPLRIQCLFSLKPETDCYPTEPPERNGGLYSNIDNNYMWLYASRHFGEVLVLRGKLPTTPATYRGSPRSGTAQLRYWSVCQNESLLTLRVEGCLYDEQVPLGQGRSYVIATSLEGDRPSNATAKCGVGYLPWPVNGDGAGHKDDAYISVRNLLPSEDFDHAIQDTRVPGDEARVLGPYMVTAEYMSTEEFEALGCRKG